MPHLYKFRQGWQSENLSRFLLSQISFIAQPSTIADDVGSDFYCTLFRKVKIQSNQHLFPKNAFVIQIKSSAKPIDLSDKAAFLEQLELPYFIGIADRNNLSLRIYSGRGLAIVFSMHGVPTKLTAKVAPPMTGLLYYDFPGGKRSHTRLKFPFIAEISAKDTEADLERIYAIMVKECALMHGNIASRRLGEFIINLGGHDLRIIAGSGSAQLFRENIARRFAEAFYNLQWINQNQPHLFVEAEFRAYENAWKAVRGYAPREERERVDFVCNSFPQT